MATSTTHFSPGTQDTAGVPPVPPEAFQQAGGREGAAPRFDALLLEALTRPGILSEAYSAFHNFSLGNQLLAAQQLTDRGMPLSPIASFQAWKGWGRYVRKGEKALFLFMPVTVKAKQRQVAPEGGAGEGGEDGEGGGEGMRTVYRLRPNWFALSQTEGEDFQPELRSPRWDAATALQALGIEEVPFEDLRGNCLGYAVARTIAISPLAPLKHKTRFHELAHVVLGHTADEDMHDGGDLGRADKEMEAESVAYLLTSLLELPGAAEARGYLQWWRDNGGRVAEKNAARIFGAADRILRAGQLVTH